MDLDLTSHTNESNIKKHIFNLKASRNDGLLLQVHHTFPSSKSRFIHAAFNDNSTQVAAADHNGKLFIIDLQTEKYWQLPDVGPLNFISFPSFKKSELLISLTSAALQFIDIENGAVMGFLSGHSSSATDVSYSDDRRFCLTSCSTEAIIWDLQTSTQAYRLSVKVDMLLKKVLFMPVSNHILACFQDDAMHIWKFGTFECIKQIIPESWKTHHLKSIALTKNGRAMVIGGHTLSLVVFCLDTWTVKKIIEFPESIPGVKQIEFVPQIFDGGANKTLALLTNSLGIYFLDIETSTFLKSMHRLEGLASKMVISPTGKYFASVLISGEVNIYTTLKVLEGDLSRTPVEIERSGTGLKSTLTVSTNQRQASRNKTMQSNEALSSIDKQIKETLTLKKLLPILKEFGEYPDSYRVLIWKTILQLPANQEAYRSLSSKECYPSYASLESQYPMVNKSLLNTLKRLLSNLSHWCPLFGEVGFLPEFAFPFVKVFHFDPFVCFEAVATIIVNWCQNWFEFYPFPPINTLAMIENVLAHHDPELLEFYYKESVTSSLYACNLLQTVLSEVLSKNEWLRLWDHVISNEPSFLLMAVVAYNVVCRNAIKSCENANDIESFFHNQIAIDMKMLISKSYYFLNNTPEDIHPRQYFAPFRALSKGGAYAAYEGYPKIIVDPNARKLQDIHKEEEEILKEQRKAIAVKKELDKRLQADNRVGVREEILKELDDKFRKIVDEEEERIQGQRRKLQNLRQELKLKELAVLETARDRALNQRAERKKIELDRLVNDISKKKSRERVELELAEDEIKWYYSELLARKCQLESDFKCKEDETTEVTENLRRQHQKLRNELHNLQNETASLHQSKHIEIAGKVAAIKDLLQNVEVEIAKEMAEKDINSCVEKNRIQLVNLKEETKALEEKVEELLNKQIRIQDGEKKSVEEILSKSHRSPNKTDPPFSLSFEDSRSKWSTAHHHNDDETNAPKELIRRKLSHKKSKSLETLGRGRKSKTKKNYNRELIRKASGDHSDDGIRSSYSDSNEQRKPKKKYHVNYAVTNVCKCTSECAYPCTEPHSVSSLRKDWIAKLGLGDFESSANLEIRKKMSDKESTSEYHSITNESSQSRCSICHERIEPSVKKKIHKNDVRRRFSRSAEDLNASNQKDHSCTKSTSEDEVIRAALSVRRRFIQDAKRFTNLNR